MLKFLPSDAILGSLNGFASRYYPDGDWFMAYEWFCRKLMEFRPDDTPFALLNETSSINNGNFYRMGIANSPRDRLVYLFKHGWFHAEAEPFLAYLGIKKWADLAKPITIIGRRPKEFPCRKWFEMRGRVLNYSPNKCHKKARWVMGFSLQYARWKKRWVAQITYGYPHDSSSWEIHLKQNYREFLDTFGKRIQAWIDEIMKADESPGLRLEQVRTWSRVYSAMRDLFYSNNVYDMEEQLADELVKIKGSTITEGKIIINPQRLATLKKWAKLTVSKS